MKALEIEFEKFKQKQEQKGLCRHIPNKLQLWYSFVNTRSAQIKTETKLLADSIKHMINTKFNYCIQIYCIIFFPSG